MSTGHDGANVASSAGHLRVVIWFGLSGIVLLGTFLFRLSALQPNWLLLLGLVLATIAPSSRAFRDLLTMKAGATQERLAQIALAVGGSLGVVAILYFSWRYGDRLNDKSLYWSDKFQWSGEEILAKRIDFESIEKTIRELLKDS